jgi:hypothetical protein
MKSMNAFAIAIFDYRKVLAVRSGWQLSKLGL